MRERRSRIQQTFQSNMMSYLYLIFLPNLMCENLKYGKSSKTSEERHLTDITLFVVFVQSVRTDQSINPKMILNLHLRSLLPPKHPDHLLVFSVRRTGPLCDLWYPSPPSICLTHTFWILQPDLQKTGNACRDDSGLFLGSEDIS